MPGHQNCIERSSRDSCMRFVLFTNLKNGTGVSDVMNWLCDNFPSKA